MKPSSRRPNGKIYAIAAALLALGLTGCWHRPAQVTPAAKPAGDKPETTVDRSGTDAPVGAATSVCANDIDVDKAPSGGTLLTAADEKTEIVSGKPIVWKLKSVRFHRSDLTDSKSPISATATLAYDGKSEFAPTVECEKIGGTKELKSMQGIVVDSISARTGEMASRYEIHGTLTAATPDVGTVKGAKSAMNVGTPKLVDYLDDDGKPMVFSSDPAKPVPMFESLNDPKRVAKITRKIYKLSDGRIEVRVTYRGSDSDDGKPTETESEAMIYAPVAAEK